MIGNDGNPPPQPDWVVPCLMPLTDNHAILDERKRKKEFELFFNDGRRCSRCDISTVFEASGS